MCYVFEVRAASRSTQGSGKRPCLALLVLGWGHALLGCSFPDPTFIDTPPGAVGGGGSSAGASNSAGSQPTDTGSVVLARAQGEVLALTADSDEVVWVSETNAGASAELRAVPTQGGDVRVVIPDQPDLLKTRALTMDSGTFFVAYDRDLLRVSRAAPALEPLFNPTDVDVLLADAAHLYLGAPWGVSRFPKGGATTGDLILLAEAGARLLSVESESVLVSMPGAAGVRLIAGDGSVAASDAPVIASVTKNVAGLDYDADRYYFSVPDDGVVDVATREDAVPSVLAQGESLPGSVVVTRAAVYWVTDSGRALRRLAKPDGKAQPVTSARPGSLTRAGNSVFWVSGDGDVMSYRD